MNFGKDLELPQTAWMQLADALLGTTHLLNATLPLDELLEMTLEMLNKAVPCDSSSIGLIKDDKMSIVAARGLGKRTAEALRMSVDLDKCISARAIRTGRPLILADAQLEEGWIITPGEEQVRGWLAVPLSTKDKTIGLLGLGSDTPGRFNEEEAEIALAFANQAAIAIENSRLFEEVEKRARRLQTAAEVSRVASSILDPYELLHRAVNLIQERFGLYYVGIFLVDKNEQYAILRAGTGEPGQKMMEMGHKLEVGGESMIGWCVANTKARIALDVGEEAVRFDNPLLPETHSEMALPLTCRGQIIGAITVQSTEIEAFSQEDITILQTMADQLANAIQNARLFQEIHITLKRLDTLNRVSQLINYTLDLPRVLEVIVSSATELAEADASGIYQWAADGTHLELKVSHGLSEEFQEGMRKSPPRIGRGAIGRAIANRAPLGISDGLAYPGYEYKDLIARAGYHSILALPMVAREKVLGGICLWWRQANRVDMEKLPVLVSLANHAATAIENARAYQEERHARVLAETLRRAGQVVNSTLALDGVLERILVEMEQVVPYDSASVQLLKKDRLEIIGGRGFSNLTEIVGFAFPLDNSSPVLEVLSRGDYLIIHDAPAIYSAFQEEPHKQANIRGWLGVPMIVGNRVIGMITLDSHRPGFYTEEHARTAQTFASHAAIAIENARLFNQTQADAKELAAIFNAITDLIYLLDTDYRIMKTNPALETWYGVSQEEVVGKLCYAVLRGYSKPCTDCPISTTLKTKRPAHAVIREQLPQKGETWLDVSTYPILDEQGELIQVIKYARDITLRKRLEEQLFQAQKMDAVGTLAGGIAHDFNNILTSILGYTSLVVDQLETGDPRRDDLQYVERAARRAADLTRQLLTFGRRSISEPKSLQVAPLIKELTKLLERTFPRNITIHTSLDKEIAPVLIEPSQLEQVIMNLCINARDAMPDGGKMLIEVEEVLLDEIFCRFHADGAKPGQYICISVSDTGRGMDKETLRQAFDPFFTTKDVGKGTGLGLAVVWGIAKNHGGFVHLYSDLGRGTTARFYLPATMAPPQEKTTTTPEIPGGTEMVLIVDDEEMVRDLARRALEDKGYRVLTANDGAEALEVYKANETDIDLVFLDLVMPVMDGREALKKLLEFNPEIKVLLASGYSANGEAGEVIQEGARGFVQKPFSAVDLLVAIHEALED